MSSIKVDNLKVRKIYSGIAGKCCCGCSGRYYNRGEKSFMMMLGKFNLHLLTIEDKCVKVEPTYVCLTVGNRWYIAYFD